MSDSDLFNESCSEDVLNPATPPDKKFKTKIACKSFIHTKRELTVLDTLWESLSVVVEKKKPYVFYTLKEMLSFNEAVAPVSNKIRTVGIYEEKGTQLQYLVDGFGVNCGGFVKLLLDFRLTEKLPLVSEQIQVFGFIDFKPLEKPGACVPVLVVHFWNVIEGNVEEFISKLQVLQRPLAVTGCRSVEDMDSSFFENTPNIDSYFDEINDTIFNEAAEAAEVVYKGFSERLNISEDLFD